MNMIKTIDGTQLDYKDGGRGPLIVFIHGWSLRADAWDGQRLFLEQQGYRVIAHDRRGYGRSEQTWDGNALDTYAEDLAALLNALDVRDAVLVGHSTGGDQGCHHRQPGDCLPFHCRRLDRSPDRGQFFAGLWLAFIGWFLSNSVSASAGQEVMNQVLQGVDVADVMDPVPASIAPTMTVRSLIFDHLLDGSHRAVAVQDTNGSLVGLAMLSDLRYLQQEEWSTTPVCRIMTPAAQLQTVTPKKDLQHAVGLLATNRYHQLPVVESNHLVVRLNPDHVLQYLQLRQLQSRHHVPTTTVTSQSTPEPVHQRVR